MRKRTIIVLAICSVVLVLTSFFLWNYLSLEIPWKFEKNISRNIDNEEEQRVLAAAEQIDYSAITSLERFHGSTEPEAYLKPSTYLAYTSSNFIDSEVIDYYETRYDNMQGKIFPKQIELIYEANVTKRSEFRIFNTPPPEGAAWYNVTIFLSSTDGSLIRKDNAHMQFFYRNQSGFQLIDRGYDFNISDCYVVEMNLKYSETYASTAAFFVKVDQIVVLDRELLPVLVGLESGMAVA